MSLKNIFLLGPLFILVLFNSASAEPYSYSALPGGYVHMNIWHVTPEIPEAHTTSSNGYLVLQVDPTAQTVVFYGHFELDPYPGSPLPSTLSFQLTAANGWFPKIPPEISISNVFDPQTGVFGVPSLEGFVIIGDELNYAIVPDVFQGREENGVIQVHARAAWANHELHIHGPFRFDGPNAFQQCQNNLAGMTADADDDSVPDYLDQCPGSVSPVDNDGCDKNQFCSQFTNSSVCKKSDWKNDQPLGASDCIWQGGKLKVCLPKW